MTFRLESRETYYETLVEWWTEHGFPILPFDSVPTKVFVVSRDNIDLYAIPVYSSDVSLCWIGFPTSNKKAPKELKSGALEFLMGNLQIAIRELGYKTIITTSDTPKLMNLFESQGFIASDQNVTYYTKRL